MRNNRTDTMMESYIPVLSIILYQTDSNPVNYYLESHVIDEKGRIGEGKPLLQETIQGMVDVFFDEQQNKQKFTGFFPENMLVFSPEPGGKYFMMWHRPAEKRVMFFSQALKMRSEQTWVPAMLYCTDGKGLTVFALGSDKRPTDKTKFYRAPFFNVNEHGGVCLGNADVQKPKDRTYENLMKYWEDLFWLSEFTHVNGTDLVKTDAKKVWTKLLTSKCKLKFPTAELVPYKITFKNIK